MVQPVEGATKIVESDANLETSENVTVASEEIASELQATNDSKVETKEEAVEESAQVEAVVDTQVYVGATRHVALLNSLQSHEDVKEVHDEATGVTEEVSILEPQVAGLTMLAHEDGAVCEVCVHA